LILHLGVVDLPYAGRETPRQVKRRLKRGGKAPAGAKTTYDVAMILESKYHVMETFAHRYKDEMAAELVSALNGRMENLLMGAPLSHGPFGEAESAIKDMFSKFLENREMDGLPGIPTKAALSGVSHRFKNKRNPNGRPSFIDTGLYESSARAWIDQ
jgi:hypothetical protein